MTSGYLLALALMLPLNGWLVHRIGAKALYLWCFAAFTLSSTLCGLAWSANSLIGFRILQGMSGGLLAPMAQMMIARAAGKRMAQVVSVAALPVLLAPLLGPVIAGAILQFASWRWLFLINLPVGVLALALAAAFLPNDREETLPRGLDLLGLALLSPGLVLFLYGSDHLGERIGALALVVSIVIVRAVSTALRGPRATPALIDLRLFKGKAFLRFGRRHVHVQRHRLRRPDADPDLSGPRLRLVTEPNRLAAGAAGSWHDVRLSVHGPSLTQWFGIRKLAACGALLALAGTLPFVFLASTASSSPSWRRACSIRGAGLSAIGIPSITSGYAAVARQDLPMATTAMNIVQRLGGPTLTTLCATFHGWRLSATSPCGVDVRRVRRGVRPALRPARPAVPRHAAPTLAGSALGTCAAVSPDGPNNRPEVLPRKENRVRPSHSAQSFASSAFAVAIAASLTWPKPRMASGTEAIFTARGRRSGVRPASRRSRPAS